MRRKLIRQGRNGCTIHLPKKWVDKRGLRPGDEITLSEEGNRLYIDEEVSAIKTRSITRDVTGLNSLALYRQINALYESGFDEIKLTFSKDSCVDLKTGNKNKISEKITEYVTTFHGLAIIHQRADFYLLKDIGRQSEEDFEIILRRTHFLLMDFDRYIKEGLQEDRKKYEQGEERYKNIVKFVSFCLRLLNKKRVPDAEKYNRQVASYYLYLCRDLTGNRISESTKKMIYRISDVVHLYHDFLYIVNNEKLIMLTEQISRLETDLAALDTKHKEFLIVYHFGTVLDIIESDIKCVLSLAAL
jgi:phosphate uptake regulator